MRVWALVVKVGIIGVEKVETQRNANDAKLKILESPSN
jgi:hypothetical protein